MSYKTSWEENGVYWAFSEALTNECLLDSIKELYSDSRFPNIEYTINDFNAVTTYPVESNIIQKIAEIDAEKTKLNSNVKIAIVANSQIVSGLTSMYKTYFELYLDKTSRKIQNFETLKEARNWVNA